MVDVSLSKQYEQEQARLSLEVLFSKVANKEPVTQDEVINAIRLLLNDPSPEHSAPTDEEIIAVTKTLIERLPCEQHFKVWEGISNELSRISDNKSSVFEFVMERGLDSIEDLPRNQRAEAAYHFCDVGFSGIPEGHPIQKKAFEKLLEYASHAYQNDVFLGLTSAIRFTTDPKMQKALLTAAIDSIEFKNSEHKTSFDTARECLGYAIELKHEDLQIICVRKSAEMLQRLPTEEERLEARQTLLDISPVSSKTLQIIEDTEKSAIPSPVSIFIQKMQGLTYG